MSWIDWLIVIVPLIFIVGIAIYSRRYARSVTDYMAAGRVAGRYAMAVGDLMAGLSVISLVAGTESGYQTGYAVGFWQNILMPISMVLALTGYCTYRWRETRCLSRGQFLELRYGSKLFRLVTAFISTSAEMITNAISPAIAANFFIYYLKLPHEVMICGIGMPCYVIIVALCLTLATVLIWPSGRISLLITDSIQGILSFPIFVIVIGFILLKFSWNIDIVTVLGDRVPEQSFLDPYDISQLRDFNLFALVVTITSNILNRAAWFGNDTSNAGRSPHEQKMAGVLGQWRTAVSTMFVLILAVMTIAFMNGERFASRNSDNPFKVTNNEIRRELSAKVIRKVVKEPGRQQEVITRIHAIPDQIHRPGVDQPFSQQKNLDTVYLQTVQNSLGDTPEAHHMTQEYRTTYQQMMLPSVLREIFPVGLLGIFCLLLVMLLISTDDSRIFNSASALVQDMVLPCYTFFCKKRLDPKTHLLLLRLTTLGVALQFFIVAILFRNMDYISMFVTIMSAFWIAGSGPVLVFGLYSRFGNLTGAWCSIIFGSGTSLLGLIGQRSWTKTIYPFLEQHGWDKSLGNFLSAVSSPFDPWIHWEINPYKFPLNSYEIFFLSMILALVTYIAGSYLTYRPFDLDKLLHRGKYADAESSQLVRTTWNLRTLAFHLLSITPEYTRGDKIIAWGVFLYSFVYKLIIAFAAVFVCNLFFRWPKEWWGWYFYLTSLIIPGLIAVVSTVWFMWGGIRDLKQLFRDLENRKIDNNDNGQVLEKDEIVR